jgi:hypothetical protein
LGGGSNLIYGGRHGCGFVLYVSDKLLFAFNGPKSSFVDDADAVRLMVMWGKEQEIVMQKRIIIF